MRTRNFDIISNSQLPVIRRSELAKRYEPPNLPQTQKLFRAVSMNEFSLRG